MPPRNALATAMAPLRDSPARGAQSGFPVGGQEDLPGGGHRRLPADRHLPTLRSVPGRPRAPRRSAIYRHLRAIPASSNRAHSETGRNRRSVAIRERPAAPTDVRGWASDGSRGAAFCVPPHRSAWRPDSRQLVHTQRQDRQSGPPRLADRAGWTTDDYRTTVVMLVRGRFRISLPSDSVILEDEDDYVMWGAGADHSWRAQDDSVVITVR